MKDENITHGAKTPDSNKSSENLKRPKSCDILVKPTTPTNGDVKDGVPTETQNEPFRLFREKSYIDLLEKEKVQKFKEVDKKQRSNEAHLVDGELKFDNDDSSETVTKPDEKLVEGNPLPDYVGTFSDKLLGKPIEEIDPNIKDKTFVVIAKRIKKKFIYRFSATKAFFILSPWNPIRRIPVYIATNQFFDYFVILTIVVNCILMAAIPDSNEIPEYVFLGIYSVEMIIKMLARGFIINKYTYLRDAWNWLDFAVIIIGYVTIIIENSTTTSNFNLSSMRTFRVLRALKTVSIIPGLRTIVNALLRAFKMLVEVITLTVFVLMVFALFALQVYMGTLRQKCILHVSFAGYTTADGNYDEFYANWVKNTTNWLTDDGGDYVMCGNASLSGTCAPNYICLGDLGENPNHGFTGFDNFLWGMLNCFQLITLDFWEDIYDKVIRTSGPWNVLFFMAVVFLGSFYLINLMLAVVAMSYEEEAESAGKDRDREKAKMKKKNNPIYDIAIMKVSTKKFRHAASKAKNRRESKDGENIVQVQPLETPSDEPQADKNKLTVNTGVTTTPASTPSSNTPHKPLVKKQSKDSGFSNRSQVSSKSSASKREVQRQESQEHLKTPQDAEDRSLHSADTLKGNTNEAFEEEDATEIDDEASQKAEGYVIITAEDENTENGLGNELIDRNWYWCQLCYCFISWLRLQNKIYTVVSHPMFDILITIVILLNTLVMATEHYGQPYYWSQVIEIANYVFTAVFMIEAVLKLTALGKFYFKSGWNVFDLLIVLASIVDLSLTSVQGLSVFRIFRLLRVFKLAQSWPTLRLLLSIIISTLGALGNLTFILLLVIYVFAVMGMQLFRKQYTADKFPSGEVPRWNFTDITHSLMLIFRVLCGEWVEPLWDCMLAADESCMLVFLAALVFGNFMVLNLFLAMLLNAFASDVLKKNSSEGEGGGIFALFKKFRAVFCACSCCKRSRTGSVGPSGGVLDETTGADDSDEETVSKELEMKTVNGNHSLTAEIHEEKTKTNSTVFIENINNEVKLTGNGVKAMKDKEESDPDADIKMGDDASTIQKTEESQIVVVEECLPAFITDRCRCGCMNKYDMSNCWSRWHTFRKIMCVIVDHKVFEGLILLIIGLSSLSLAFEDAYLHLNPQLQLALKYLDYIFFVIFAVEMVMKWIAYGLKKYFTTFWTILDFGIVAVSLASLITEATGLTDIGAFRSLRTLRAFRPLRAISRWQSMKIVVNALMMAIPSIFNVLLVCLVFWLIFSIMGVQFFAGKFYKCVDAGGVRLDASIVPDKTTCLANGYQWANSKINFDNVFQGLLALLQVATFEGWIEVMVDAVDITGIDLQPKRENTLISYLFFVIFIIFGSFFTLNLFIGVIIDNFNMLKKKYEGGYLDAFLTPSQRNYYNTLKKLGTKKPQKTIKRPKNKWQAFFFDISISSKFELAIVAVIITNMIVMAIDHYNQTQVITDTLDIMNIVFTSVFALEATIKLIGLRWHYFRQAWNVFDFIVVLLSLLGIILDDILSTVFITPTLLRVVRVFRIGRVLRLIKAAKGIRKLLFALVISLPALFNIGALLFLVLYIYAIIGMSTFMNVKLTGFFNDLVNFRTFLNSFVLLFRLATSAGWNEILDALLVQPPDCTEALGDCGIPWFATLYMVSYIIIIFLIVINTYIAVILENFSQAHEQEEVGITEDDFEMFYMVWERYDPLATQFIKYEQLQDFVADLEEPLGIDKPNEIALVSFDLPIVEGDKLHCLDILMALVKNVLGKVEQTEETEQLQTQMEIKFQETFPTRVKTIVKSSTMQRKKEDVAAKTLQRAWRGYKAQKQLRAITGMAMLNVATSSAPHSRSNSVVSLGRRLSNALSSFFNTSRPSSAVSRRSVVTVTGTISPRGRRTKNVQVS